jgi:DNA-binding XRE family transcriptional regulator
LQRRPDGFQLFTYPNLHWSLNLARRGSPAASFEPRQLEYAMMMAKQFRNSALFPPHSEDSYVLDFVMLRTYVPDRKFERIGKLPRKPNFARYLRDARTKRGLSVAEVAEQVGVSTASIYFWENDHVRPRDENLSALCKVLKLPVKATREMAAA